MRIFVRSDASLQLGSGHIMRCLALTDALRSKGAEVSFICREQQGNLRELLQNKGYQVFRLPPSNLLPQEDTGWESDAEETSRILQDAGHCAWLVIDHYLLDCRWESKLRRFVNKIMVIDDLANRRHDCDLLLDQNLHENPNNRYDGLLPDHCQRLLGPSYALLRPEFTQYRQKLRSRDGHIKRILISFGGSDPTNETARALQAITLLGRNEIALDVVVGSSNPHKAAIKEICSTIPQATFHCQADNMAELMGKADLAIGAGGSTTWERCCMGLPSIALIVAENQAEITRMTAAFGALINLGRSKEVSVADIVETLSSLFSAPSTLLNLSMRAQQLVDGKGTDRVTNNLRGQNENFYSVF